MTRKKKGILIIIIGLGMLPLSLVGWSIARFTVNSMSSPPFTRNEYQIKQISQPETNPSSAFGEKTSRETTTSLFNILFSLLPIVGLFILTPVGIVMMLKGDIQPSTQQQ